MIELKNISVSFDKLKVLKDITCKIEAGDFITIVGENGVGKTTLFDTIAGKTIPSDGKIFIDDKDITDLGELQRASFIGRLFQNPQLSVVSSMSVKQNFAMVTTKGRRSKLINGMQNFHINLIRKILLPLNMDLENLLDKPMSSLSGGQRQIISLLMATMVPPKILLLDEPTAALDPQAATKLLIFAAKFIKEHKITTLLITHDPNIALSLGNKLWILQDGQISKQFFGQEKISLSPNKLIGQIDYNQITEHVS